MLTNNLLRTWNSRSQGSKLKLDKNNGFRISHNMTEEIAFASTLVHFSQNGGIKGKLSEK